MNSKGDTKGWGVVNEHGQEMWDAQPVFSGERIDWKAKLRLFFYPKKFVLYRAMKKHIARVKKRYAKIEGGERYVPLIVDVGCGTGASVIDFKKMFGRSIDVMGFEPSQIQVELAQKKMKQHGVWATVAGLSDTGRHDVHDGHADVVYTSDVLGHVEDVPAWLDELQRMLRPGGMLAMFTESKLGKHAYLRNYFMKHGVNTDPHAEFHISLYSKATLTELLEQHGFEIKKMYSTVWAKFLVHPDELYPGLQKQNKLFFWKWLNAGLYFLKKWTKPVSTALAEGYSLVEMLTLGRVVESQGYVIVAYKKTK